MPLVSDTPRWMRVLAFGMLVAVLLANLVLLRVGFSSSDAVNATKDSVARTDCARQVNAEQTAAKDAATLADRAASRADRAANRYYFEAVLNATVTRAQVTKEQVDEFGRLLSETESLTATADEADKVVADLPDPAKEVDRRCPG